MNISFLFYLRALNTVGGGSSQLFNLAADHMVEFRKLQEDGEARKALEDEYLAEREVRRTGMRIGRKSQAAVFATATQNLKVIVSASIFYVRKYLTHPFVR